MIKFFRKIRQNLLMENKLGKYLLYAIGEIFLVVIGILIALQINNQNEVRKNKSYEAQYLVGIKSNIDQDINELEIHFVEDTIMFDSNTYLIRTCNSDSAKSKTKEILSNIYSAFDINWFEGQNVIFEDMKSSGKMHLIQSDSIRLKIQIYYRLFVEVIKQEEIFNSEIRELQQEIESEINISSLLEPMLPERWNGNVSSFNLTFLDKPLIKDKMINNWSGIKARQFSNHMERTELYQQAIDLNKEIEQYLTNNK